MPASGEMDELDSSPVSKKFNTRTTVNELDLASRHLVNLPTDILTTNSPSITSLLLDHNDLVSLPEEFGKLFPHLEILSLTGNVLMCLPDSIGCLECLKELYINENDISVLCDSVSELQSLEVFKATGNEITYIPDDFGKIKCLKTLYIDENKLLRLPKTLGMLRNLEILECGENQIENVPENIGQLKCLRIVNMCDNKLESIPDSLGDLKCLEIVDLSGNFIEALPSYFYSTKSLRKIFADRNKIAVIPDWMSDLDSVVEISLKDNKFQSKPLTEKFGFTCKQLKVLDLGGNFMTNLPDSIGSLKSLEKFCLGSVIDELERRAFQNGNWISILPDSFCDLVNLRELHLDENLFLELPREFGNLVNLEFLDVASPAYGVYISQLIRYGRACSNYEDFITRGQLLTTRLQHQGYTTPRLKSTFRKFFGRQHDIVGLYEKSASGQNLIHELPESFGNLKSLKICQLSKNKLELLPSSFGNLSALEDLRLDNNALVELPESFCKLTNIKTLDLFNNRLTEVPAALKYFTKLIRMDLQANHFNIPWHEVPEIMTSSKYPERDPKLKNNWRGRPRQDIVADNMVIHKLQDMGDEEDEQKDEEEENNENKYEGYSYREDLFRMAAARNLSSSIWRTHTGPSKREKFVRCDERYNSRRYNCEEDQEDGLDGDETENSDNDDNYEPPIFTPRPRNSEENKNGEVKEQDDNVSEPREDWDAEIEEVQVNEEDPYGTFSSLYCHAQPRTLAEAGYVVDDHLFLPYDIHNQPIIKPNVIYRVEDGQFDDDDDDDEEEQGR